MRRLVLILPLLLFAVSSCRQASFDDQCLQQAREYTEKQCPRKMSEGVVLDSMTYSKALRCLSYHYTLSGEIDDAKLVQGNIDMFRRQLLSMITNSVELKRAKDEGVSFRYVYISASSRKQLVSITLRKEDYDK